MNDYLFLNRIPDKGMAAILKREARNGSIIALYYLAKKAFAYHPDMETMSEGEITLNLCQAIAQHPDYLQSKASSGMVFENSGEFEAMPEVVLVEMAIRQRILIELVTGLDEDRPWLLKELEQITQQLGKLVECTLTKEDQEVLKSLSAKV